MYVAISKQNGRIYRYQIHRKMYEHSQTCLKGHFFITNKGQHIFFQLMNNAYNFNHHMKVTFSGSFEWSLYTGLTVLICLLNAILFTIIYRRWLHIRKTPHAFSLRLLHPYVHYTAYLLLGRNIPSYNGIIIIITKSITWMYKIILYSNMTFLQTFWVQTRGKNNIYLHPLYFMTSEIDNL